MSILVIGEALIDVQGGEGGETRTVGGSPLNVSVALGRLGNAVTLLTDIGDDPDGARIQHHARASHVALAGEPRGDTSTAAVQLGPDGSPTYEFDVRWDPRLTGLTDPYALIHTGSIAIFLDPGAQLVAEILLARNLTTIITLDPNIRPALIGDHSRAVERFEKYASLSDVVKLSDEDGQWLYPKLDRADVLDHIAALGPGLTVITLGAEGAILRSRGATVHVPARKVQVTDTIGAGDAFMGALLHGMLHARLGRTQLADGLAQDALIQLGTMAVHAAAINVSRQGANPPTSEELTAAE